jgi:integrase
MRGHVERRASGSWKIVGSSGFSDAGRRIRITRTVRGSRRDAEKALTKLLREIDQGTVARSGADTFGSYLTERWLPHMRSRVGMTSWERYESLVRVHIVPRCGRVKLGNLRPHHLQAVVDGMLADGAAPASVVKAKIVMGSALAQAVRWQVLALNPAAGVSPPRAQRPTLRVPAPEEMRKLLEAAAGTFWDLPVLLAASTGMRRGEIVALHWTDVDLEAARLAVRRGKTDTARRTINLSPSTVAALKRHRKDQNERRLLCGEAWQDTELVVDRGDGGPIHPVSFSAGFAKIAESVGLPDVRLHDLRHGFATALLKAGVNVKVVSEALGHSRTAFTMDVYAHVLPGMGEQVASAIEAALGDNSGASQGRDRP